MREIGVIVPAYGVDLYIERCIKSVINQTNNSFELYLVDDGSGDLCGEIIDEYALEDERLCAIHQKNGGLSAARNTALDLIELTSDVEWLTFIDSDDWVNIYYLEYLYNAVIQNELLISKTNAKTASVYEDNISSPTYNCSVIPVENSYIREDGWMISHAWGRMIHKTLFKGIRFPVGRLWEDIFTMYKVLFQVSSIAVVDCQLYSYFQRSGSIVNSVWNKSKLDSIDAYDSILPFFRDRQNEDFYKKILRSYNLCLRWLYRDVSNSNASQNTKNEVTRLIQRKLKNNFSELRTFEPTISVLKEKRKFFYILYPKLSYVYRKFKRAFCGFME